MKGFNLIAKATTMCVVLYTVMIAILDGKNSDEFVVVQHEKRMSTAALKEKIGDNVQELFDVTTGLLTKLGSIHTTYATIMDSTLPEQNLAHNDLCSLTGQLLADIAWLQNRCSVVGRMLLNNEDPFKKAKKQELRAVRDLVDSIITDLKNVTASFDAICCALRTSEKKGRHAVVVAQMTLMAQQKNVIKAVVARSKENNFLNASC